MPKASSTAKVVHALAKLIQALALLITVLGVMVLVYAQYRGQCGPDISIDVGERQVHMACGTGPVGGGPPPGQPLYPPAS